MYVNRLEGLDHIINEPVFAKEKTKVLYCPFTKMGRARGLNMYPVKI